MALDRLANRQVKDRGLIEWAYRKNIRHIDPGNRPVDLKISSRPRINNDHHRIFPHPTREQSSMNRKELIEALATKTDSSKANAERAVAGLIDIISATLKKGDSLTLVGFGTFEVRKRAARTGRNPKTGEELKIKASKVPAFKPGATLKATVNGAKK
jgi:DNA-binding protein HU-beta